MEDMRDVLGFALLAAGVFTAALAFTDNPCDGDGVNLLWILAGASVIGLAAFVFAQRPTVPPVAPWAIAVCTTVVAYIGIGFLSAFQVGTGCTS